MKGKETRNPNGKTLKKGTGDHNGQTVKPANKQTLQKTETNSQTKTVAAAVNRRGVAPCILSKLPVEEGLAEIRKHRVEGEDSGQRGAGEDNTGR